MWEILGEFMIKIFIGYDPREPVAFHVCASSIIRHASQPVAIIPLALNTLSSVYSETHTDGSNQFIYSRFLVPSLCDYQGHAIFIDGDMLIKDDIAKLWQMRDSRKAVQCVQHDYKTKQSIKYLGAKNEDYPRKNWSSVMIFNCAHKDTRKLSADYIAQSTGAHLHRMAWTSDEFVGDLPLVWNWLVTEYDYNDNARLLHYTLGTPCFDDYKGCDHSTEWHQELSILTSCENG